MNRKINIYINILLAFLVGQILFSCKNTSDEKAEERRNQKRKKKNRSQKIKKLP